ncbi:glycoside hydrolase family 2 TIM barrel-domain containing protein [Kribbella sp. NPDC056861]|uniref:glycoside hydrolase family 2 TIM barrel-domain containing protein n=1 Tax=Kribbella sp. NPDC056861 TaxID=3154857 RepID=UPI00341552FE
MSARRLNWFAALVVLSGVLVAVPGFAGPADGPADVHTYLEDPGKVAEGQVAPHSRLWPYADEASAVRGEGSPYVRSLDGSWKFKLVDKPGDVPAGYQAPGYDDSSWSTVNVPHTWQSDFLDHPMFRNIPEEVWPDVPPAVPRDVNPTGAYLKTFTVPTGETGRRQLLRFEGVTSGYFVWVNGKYVGYDQGGYSPAEFDITDVAKPGRNLVAVQVHRWGSGSYLEDYDQWRYAGIFRDVYSYSVPSARIQDAYVTTDLDASYRDATLSVDAELAGAAPGSVLTATLRDPSGKVASTLSGGPKLTGVVQNPAKWSDETPTLYSLVLTLTDPAGQVVHRTSQRVGFREIEVKDKQVLLNGKRILFRGVNRAETDPKTGRHVTREAMEKDVRLMKQLHVNAVRTSHYESDPYWYELADKYGLLIDDEVDIETHAHESCPSECLASKPEWQAAYHDRFVAMVERDKNHPSVVFWDTGNEAGLGTAHYAMAEWADRNEPTRLLYHQSNSPDGDAPFADVAGPRYPTPASLENKAKTFSKPIVMGEYAHAMGNGLGNFDQFWALARKYPSMQGGFIWDWAEQNLEQPLITTPDSSPGKVQAFFVGKPAVVPGHQGNGVELSSLDDFVNVFRAPALDVGRELTLDAWVKPASWTGSMPILTKGQQYALQQPGEKTLEFRVTLNGREKVVTAPTPSGWLGSWHRVTGTYDGAALTLYVDGAPVASTPATGTIEPGIWEVNVGRNAQTQQDQTSTRLAHGTFDQIRILRRALSGAEIAGGGDFPQDAVLALDFEKTVNAGRFQSLGISLSGTDGLIGTDRYLQPETVEMAWSQSPLRFSSTAPGVVTLRNEQQFAPLTFDLRWAVRQAGEVVKQGTLPVTLPPDSSRTVELPVAADNPRSLERFLDLDAVSGDALVQRDQFRIGGTVVAGVGARPAVGQPTVVTHGSRTVVSGQDFSYTFVAGKLTSLVARGKELLKRGPELDVWRPPTSNETYDWGTADRQVWNELGLDRLQSTTGVVGVKSLSDGRVEVTVPSVSAAPGHAAELSFDQTMTYTVDAAGAITLAHQVTPRGSKLTNLPYLPRVGFSLQVPETLSKFAYYGRGPEESYNDRASGTRVGVYRSSVDEQYVRYSRPQAYGNHTDTRWTSLTDSRDGVLVAAAKGDSVDVSVTPYDRLDRAEYEFQKQFVRNPGWVTLHVGDAETGMGETPNSVQAPYRIDPTQPRSYAVTLRPLSAAEAVTGAPVVTGPAACDPTVAVKPQGEAKQGVAQTVQVTVTGECAEPVRGTVVKLAAPSGWTVAPVTRSVGDIVAGQTKTADFAVTPPVSAGFGDYQFVATTTYDGGLPITSTAAVSLPLAPGQRWASDLPFAGAPTNGWGPVERDASNGEDAGGDGGPLVLGTITYAKGFGAHANSLITLDVPAGCTRFDATVGLDAEVGGSGSVTFEVRAGGAVLATTPRLTGGGSGVALTADLSGQAQVQLAVTDAGDGNGLDHADWAAARLTC